MVEYEGIKFANKEACYVYRKLQRGRTHTTVINMDWLDAPWAADEKKACEWLDTIDVLSYIDKGWIDIYALMEMISDDYPEQEDTFNALTIEEFIEYLQCRYYDNINTQEKVITNYYVQRKSC